MNIFNVIKGVIYKMLNKSELRKTFKTDIAVSNDMNTAIKLWADIYENKAYWLSDNVKSLNIGSQVANELAKLMVLEFESEIAGSKRADYLNSIYKDKVLKNLLQNIERGNAKGGLIFKPYVTNNGIEMDFIDADKFVPVDFDSNGRMTAAIFISQLHKGDEIYSKLEFHKLNSDTKEYVILNKAFKSRNKNELGNKISLVMIDEWKNIEEEIVIKNMTVPLFSYYRVPFGNNIDVSSPLGVSCYSKAIDLIRDADEQYGRVMWEYIASEKAVYVDILAIRDSNNQKIKMDKNQRRLYKSLNVGKEEFFKDYSPEIRDEQFWRGLNQIKRLIEYNCGLAYGTISDPNETDKTATEIKSSKKRSYDTVCTMQKSLEDSLKQLIESLDTLATLYELEVPGKYEATFNWDDSILNDLEKEREQDMKDVASGLMNAWEYRVKWYGETEEIAKANIPATPNIIL